MRNNRRGVLELDHRLGRPVPADIDIAHDAVWLAGSIRTISIEIDPRLDRIEALPDASGRRIIEPQRLRPLGADRICVFELDEHAGRRKPSRVERRWVKREFTSYEVDAAKHALRCSLAACNHDVAHASVVAADRLADDFEVKGRVVEDNILAAVCTDICKVVRERPHAVPAHHCRAIRPRQRTIANPFAGRASVAERRDSLLGNAPVVHTILGEMHTVYHAGRRHDITGLQIAAHWSLGINERTDGEGIRADLAGLGSDDGECRVGAGTAGSHRPDDDRLAGDVLDVALGIGEPDADCRLRVVLQRHVV